ncbi:co-chaperone GroES [Acidaminobacterium chupaoyuni]
MKLQPLTDRVVIKMVKMEETRKSGLIITGAAQEKPQMAEVIAVGPGLKDHAIQVKVGDKVITSQFSGTTVKIEGEEYIIVRENDILAIVE